MLVVSVLSLKAEEETPAHGTCSLSCSLSDRVKRTQTQTSFSPRISPISQVGRHEEDPL